MTKQDIADWKKAVADASGALNRLVELQAAFAEEFDAMTDNQQTSRAGLVLEAVVEFDLAGFDEELTALTADLTALPDEDEREGGEGDLEAEDERHGADV